MEQRQIRKPKASLVERIVSAQGTLSIVHAPAGFGKTTLLDAVRGTLTQRGAILANRIEETGDDGACPWLILDFDSTVDLDGDLLHRLLNRAIASHTGIVIATRHAETLPIARLRAAGRIVRLGARQIGLAPSEAAAALRSVVDRRTADRLAELADGWTVAIALLVDYASDADARFDEEGDFLVASGLSAYIDQEVLAGLPEPWVLALRFASIVGGCDRAMLDAIRPDDDLGRHLTSLRTHLPGLVEELDGRTVLNPLLRLHLSRQFEQLPRAERAETLDRAVRSCARDGRVAEAASLVTRVGDPRAIVDFVRRSQGLRLWVTAGFDVIREITVQAGARGIEDEPRLKLLKCLVHMKDGEIGEGEQLYNEAVCQIAGDQEAERDAHIVRTTLLIYGCRTITDADLAGFRKYILRNNDDPASKTLIFSMQSILSIQRGDLDQGVANVVEASKHARAAHTAYGLLFLDLHSTNIALARGDLQRARAMLGQARKTWRQQFPADVGVQTLVDALSACLEFEAGRLSSARVHIRRSTQRMPHVEAWLDIYAAAYEPMARLLAFDIGLASTLASLDAQRNQLDASGLPRVAALVRTLEICLRGEAMLRGRLGELAPGSLRPDPLPSLPAWQERELFGMAAAYHHLAEGKPQAALDSLRDLIDFAEPRGLERSLLRARLLLVAVLDRQGDTAAADTIFDVALTQGARLGMVRVLAEVGGDEVRRRILARIHALAENAVADPALLKLLRMLARWEDASAIATTTRMTARETDVLLALEQGGADKLIGRRLGITEHAVRYHLKNIYRKLGVHDRVGALSRARESGLLS